MRHTSLVGVSFHKENDRHLPVASQHNDKGERRFSGVPHASAVTSSSLRERMHCCGRHDVTHPEAGSSGPCHQCDLLARIQHSTREAAACFLDAVVPGGRRRQTHGGRGGAASHVGSTVIEALTPHPAQEGLSDRIGARGVRRSCEHLAVTRLCNPREDHPKRVVGIPDEVLRPHTKGGGLPKVVRRPRVGG